MPILIMISYQHGILRSCTKSFQWTYKQVGLVKVANYLIYRTHNPLILSTSTQSPYYVWSSSKFDWVTATVFVELHLYSKWNFGCLLSAITVTVGSDESVKVVEFIYFDWQSTQIYINVDISFYCKLFYLDEIVL